MSSGLSNCARCGRSLIAEELDSHSCREIERGKIEDGLFWVFDGETWYPYKLHPKSPDSDHGFGDTRRFDKAHNFSNKKQCQGISGPAQLKISV